MMWIFKNDLSEELDLSQTQLKFYETIIQIYL